MAQHLLATLYLVGLSATLASADYTYYYPSSRSQSEAGDIVRTRTTRHFRGHNKDHSSNQNYKALCNKVKSLETKVQTLEQPVHVHVSGSGDTATTAGTHVYVHVRTDGQQGGVTTAAPTSNEYRYASCYVQPNPAGTSAYVRGYVHLRQRPTGRIEIKTNLSGFPSAGLYGFHVHELATFENGCTSFGGHYNPYGLTHGGPTDATRHVGDWGNIQVPLSGLHTAVWTDNVASLFGSESIIGRGIVIHAGTDDLGRGGNAGSLKTGNAGARLACCAIGLSNSASGSW